MAAHCFVSYHQGVGGYQRSPPHHLASSARAHRVQSTQQTWQLLVCTPMAFNHWQCAKSADVELSGLGGSWKAAYEALWSKQATKPAPLQRLSYSCKIGSPYMHRAQWGGWILLLLRRVPADTMLELRTDFRPKIPTLSQLKHLILDGPSPKLGYAMKGLPCLETLFLSGSLDADLPDSYKLLSILMPKSLKHFRMGCICLPPGLVLPKNCTITMVISGQNTSLKKYEDLGYTWCAMRMCPLYLLYSDFGCGSRPLSMFVKSQRVCLSKWMPNYFLCSLCVEGDYVDITLPAMKTLQKVLIRASVYLDLACEDVEVFAASIEALSVKCCTFKCEDGVIERLKRSLAVRGKQLIDPRRDWLFEYQLLMVPEQADLAGWETVCDCKCCGICLKRAGLCDGRGMNALGFCLDILSDQVMHR
jgi:hypothetical protein